MKTQDFWKESLPLLHLKPALATPVRHHFIHTVTGVQGQSTPPPHPTPPHNITTGILTEDSEPHSRETQT